MEKKEIHIVKEILGNSIALHDFGKPVAKYVEKIIDNIISPTLIILNLQDVNPMDYEFVNIAFNTIIQKYLNDQNLYLAFKVGKWELEELLTGLIDILKLKKEEGVEEKDTLIKSKFSLMTFNDDNKVNYLSSLSTRSMDVLNEIEIHNDIQSSKIQETFTMNAEDTSLILSDLLTCKFIYKSGTESGPLYNSIKSLI